MARKKNPTAEEMLQTHSESWTNVRWETLEFDEEDAAEMPYTFSVKVPCDVPDDTGDEKVAERRIESAVRHFFARAVTLPTGQRVLPGVRLRPAGVPGVGIHVEVGYGDVDVTMSFDPDVSGQTLRDIVSLLDAVDANPGALCPFPPAPEEDEDEEENPRMSQREFRGILTQAQEEGIAMTLGYEDAAEMEEAKQRLQDEHRAKVREERLAKLAEKKAKRAERIARALQPNPAPTNADLVRGLKF